MSNVHADIFISYRRSDGAAFAEGLANELKLRGYRVFFDKKNITPGSDFPKNIEEAIIHAREIFLIATPAYFGVGADKRVRIKEGDDWVRKELKIAMKQESLNMFPILVDCLPPTREELPKGLKRVATLNFTFYNKAFDTYERIINHLSLGFSSKTQENAIIGKVSSMLSEVDVNDNRQFNLVCKAIINHLEDEHGLNALKHILEVRNDNDYLYPKNYRYVVLYTMFSYYRRMHWAMKLLHLVENYGNDFIEYSFTNYIFVEYYQIKFKLERVPCNIPKHLQKSLYYAKEAVRCLPDNNGIIHSFCLVVAVAGENEFLVSENDQDQAMRYINLIIDKDPEYGLYYCTRARLLANKGAYKEALIDLKIAQTMEHPNHNDWILRIAEYNKIETIIRIKMNISD